MVQEWCRTRKEEYQNVCVTMCDDGWRRVFEEMWFNRINTVTKNKFKAHKKSKTQNVLEPFDIPTWLLLSWMLYIIHRHEVESALRNFTFGSLPKRLYSSFPLPPMHFKNVKCPTLCFRKCMSSSLPCFLKSSGQLWYLVQPGTKYQAGPALAFKIIVK